MLADVDGFVYTNNSSTSITLNDDAAYPFTKQLDIVLDSVRLTQRPKNQADGMNPTLQQLGGMTITCEGDIFGDDSSDYFTKRLALLAVLRDRVAGTRGDGSLALNFVGSSELFTCPLVYITGFTAPIQADVGPARTPYMISFWDPDPFFIGGTSGDQIYYA